jgi:hypothetical protein
MSQPKKYLLRWRYEWADRPTKFGMWSNQGSQDDLSTKAWCHNHEGLVSAIIEAKNIETREVKPVVRVPGQDFRNFQWLAVASVPMSVAGGKLQPMSQVVGLKIQTRDEEVSVYDDGTLHRAPFEAHNINFATYGI